MNLEENRESLEELGVFFENCIKQYNGELAKTENSGLNFLQTEAVALIDRVKNENGWFTSDSVLKAFEGWVQALKPQNIEKWIFNYKFEEKLPKKVGVIMAGNIPLVGLHDALCVLLSGNVLLAKLSSKDKSLITLVLNALKRINREWGDRIIVAENLKEIDNLIATGSDNSARYFEYYFKDKAKLIRKNRTSVAVINGDENEEDFVNLGHDIFTHYGLGCRNVTKVFVPNGFDLDRIFKGIFPYVEVGNHNKYANNYDYNKAVYLLNQIKLVENGFILFKEDEGLHSPVGVLFYEFYSDISDVKEKLSANQESIQCIVTNENLENRIPFGKAQSPELWDYADGVDTLDFLLKS